MSTNAPNSKVNLGGAFPGDIEVARSFAKNLGDFHLNELKRIRKKVDEEAVRQKLSKSQFGAEGFIPTADEKARASESEQKYMKTREELKAKYGNQTREVSK